jgi:hypothetical protein
VDIATRHKKTPDKQWFCLLFFLLRAPDIMHTTKIYTRSKVDFPVVSVERSQWPSHGTEYIRWTQQLHDGLAVASLWHKNRTYVLSATSIIFFFLKTNQQ